MGDILHSVWFWFGMTVSAICLFLMIREEVKERRVRREKKELETQVDEIEDIKRKKDLP
jgi:uncharacterized membrane protein YciS (DUF1049 family)